MFSIDTSLYNDQLADKRQRLCTLFESIEHPQIEVFKSPKKHFRMRAEFRVWHEEDDFSYAMFEAGHKASSKTLIKLNDFPIANQAISELMPTLRQKILGNTLLKERLYQIEFLSTLSGDMLVTLIYHKKLSEDWEASAKALAQQLGIHIIGRSRKQKCVLSQDYVVEKFSVGEHTYLYKQIEGGFTQPNAAVCQQMLAWACECAGENNQDLLELYCGNGNFTLPLSKHFRKVLATEVSKTSVNAALWNCEKNLISNLKIARLSSEEFTQAYNGTREFRRLTHDGIVLSEYNFNTIFVDPPRAGIDEKTLDLVARFDHIIYISCNPNTLKRDIEILSSTHKIKRLSLFDQFPYTDHIESGVLLIKN